MKSKRRIIGILAAVILATIGTLALVRFVNSAKDKAVAKETLVDVYLVDKLVPKGADAQTIKSSVSIDHVPPRLKQPGAIDDLGDVGDNVAATDLQPGDQLVAARLIPKDAVAVEIKDKVQVSAMLTPERSVGGTLKAGDLVGVYLSFDPFELDKAGQDPAVTSSSTAPDSSQPVQSPSTTDPPGTAASGQDGAEEHAERDPAGVPARARHRRAGHQRPRRRRRDGQKDDKGISRSLFAVHRHPRPLARAVGALRVRRRVRPRVAVQRPGHRLRRRHPAGHARQRLLGGEVMDAPSKGRP